MKLSFTTQADPDGRIENCASATGTNLDYARANNEVCEDFFLD